MMNNPFLKSVCLPAFAVFVLSGCIVYDAQYTKNAFVERQECLPDDQIPVSYSIRILSSPKNAFEKDIYERLRNDLQAKIMGALNATMLFSGISYDDNWRQSGKGGCHIEFDFCKGDIEQAGSFVSGFTLMTIPVTLRGGFDLSATVYLNSKPQYAVAKAEEMRALVWLPLFPVGLFKNFNSALSSVTDGSVNALVTSIAREHKRRLP